MADFFSLLDLNVIAGNRGYYVFKNNLLDVERKVIGEIE